MPDSVDQRPGGQDSAGLSELIARAAGSGFLESVRAPDADEVSLLPSALLPAIDLLKRAGYNLLLDIGVTDHQPLSPRFEISYHLLSMPSIKATPHAAAARFRLRVFAADDAPVIPSLCGVWPNADWPEREAFDMFGIVFDGHPNLRRILMPEDWEGYPLRKDYPLRGFDRRFTPGGRVGPVPDVRTTV